MAGYTETGYLRVALDVTIMGAMGKSQAQKMESDLLDFFAERKVNLSGKISFIQISALEVDKSYGGLNTSEKQ